MPLTGWSEGETSRFQNIPDDSAISQTKVDCWLALISQLIGLPLRPTPSPVTLPDEINNMGAGNGGTKHIKLLFQKGRLLFK